VLLAPSPEFAHISSTLVRQIASMGGDASGLVPENVAQALRARFPARGHTP
jgi:pantetheine-phosphate adenylyltransferase